MSTNRVHVFKTNLSKLISEQRKAYERIMHAIQTQGGGSPFFFGNPTITKNIFHLLLHPIELRQI